MILMDVKTMAIRDYNCQSLELINFVCIFAQKSCIVNRILR